MDVKFHRLDSPLRGNDSVDARQASFSIERSETFLCHDWKTSFSISSQEVLPVGQNVMVLYPSGLIPAVCGGYLSK